MNLGGHERRDSGMNMGIKFFIIVKLAFLRSDIGCNGDQYLGRKGKRIISNTPKMSWIANSFFFKLRYS